MKTFSPKPRDIERRWYVIDAEGAVLGRLASEVAKILRGKHKPIYAPHMDTGDHVIVVNAKRVRLTGGKEEEKVFYRHSGYPGGLRGVGYVRLMAERPALAVERAVRGMLPKTRLGRQMIGKLAVYEGPDHPHRAQQPAALPLGEMPKWTGLPPPPATHRGPEQEKEAARPGRSRAGAKSTARSRPRAGRAAGTSAAGSRAGGKAPRQGAAAKRTTARPRRSTTRAGAKQEPRTAKASAEPEPGKAARKPRARRTKET